MDTLTSRQEEILRITIEIIASKGMESLTMKNIARELAISDAALYRHFKNKKAILLALLDMFEKLSEMPPMDYIKESSLDKIEVFLLDRYQKFSVDPDLAKVMFSEGIFINDPDLAARMREIMHSHRETISEFVLEGQRNGEITKALSSKSAFRLIIGSMRLLVTQWCLNDFSFDLFHTGVRLWRETKEVLKV